MTRSKKTSPAKTPSPAGVRGVSPRAVSQESGAGTVLFLFFLFFF